MMIDRERHEIEKLLRRVEKDKVNWQNLAAQHAIPGNEPENEAFRALPARNLERLELLKNSLIKQLEEDK